jgi:hypothetical protein
MSKDDTHVGKTQAIRVCLAEHPDANPTRVVEILAARDIQVSPAHVIVVQAVLRSEKADRVAAAS